MTETPQLLVVDASEQVWRVGFKPEPWAWSGWEWAGADGRFHGRWDDRQGNFRTVYAGSALLACLLEVLAGFRPDPTLRERFRVDEGELTEIEREELEAAVGMMRAVGLLTGELDLLDAFGDLQGNTTLAYYDFEKRMINIRGTRVTDATKSTIVHELTHALQDQHFRIGERMRELSESSEDGVQDSRKSILEAVIEGDAQRVETLYRASLSPTEQAALDSKKAGESEDALAATQDIPRVLMTMMASTYVLGRGLVDVVATDGGNDAVDALLRDPPVYDDVMADPLAFLEDDSAVEQVPVPQLPEGASETYSGEFGVVWWYFMLAERMPEREAMASLAGYGGDAMRSYENEGRSCVKLVMRAETPADSRVLAQALHKWADATPEDHESVSLESDEVRLEACDPGSQAKTGRDASMKALELLGLRAALGNNLLRSGAPVGVARCLADSMIGEYTTVQLSDPLFGAEDLAVQRRVVELLAACR